MNETLFYILIALLFPALAIVCALIKDWFYWRGVDRVVAEIDRKSRARALQQDWDESNRRGYHRIGGVK